MIKNMTRNRLKERFEDENSWREGFEIGSFVVLEDVLMSFVKENVIKILTNANIILKLHCLPST